MFYQGYKIFYVYIIGYMTTCGSFIHPYTEAVKTEKDAFDGFISGSLSQDELSHPLCHIPTNSQSITKPA